MGKEHTAPAASANSRNPNRVWVSPYVAATAGTRDAQMPKSAPFRMNTAAIAAHGVRRVMECLSLGKLHAYPCRREEFPAPLAGPRGVYRTAGRLGCRLSQ